MSITHLRNDLEEIRALIESNQAKQALDKLNLALANLDQEKPQTQSSNGPIDPVRAFRQQCQEDEDAPYLDGEDATRWLGSPSEAETRKFVLRQGLKHKSYGDLIMIPIDELERVEQSKELHALREAKRAADKAKVLAACNGHLKQEGEDEPYLPSEVAAQWLGIGTDITLRFAARDQEIKHKRDGKRLLIPLSELERIDHTERIESSRAIHYTEEQLMAMGIGGD